MLESFHPNSSLFANFRLRASTTFLELLLPWQLPSAPLSFSLFKSLIREDNFIKDASFKVFCTCVWYNVVQEEVFAEDYDDTADTGPPMPLQPK